MRNFKKIADKLSEDIKNIQYEKGDLSDLGNEVGISLGEVIKNESDLEDFIIGLEHGISLVNGTHDFPEKKIKHRNKN